MGGTEIIIIFLEIWKTTRVQDQTPKVDEEDPKIYAISLSYFLTVSSEEVLPFKLAIRARPR